MSMQSPTDVELEEIIKLDEAIQNLPPELREIIYKEYVAMKQRERAALGWNKVHEDILKKPFCNYRQQIIPAIICIECMNRRFGGCCNFCWMMEKILNIEPSYDYKKFSLMIDMSRGFTWNQA